MKHNYIIALFLLFSFSCFSQGIVIREGSWEDMLRAAVKEKKMVFVDFYTSWCGPCKMMAKKVFVEKEVGDFYNQNFICYKLDAEKEEGMRIAQQYGIDSYPTFLFVDGRGNVFYRFSGYMTGKEFVAKGKAAVNEFRSSNKTIEKWEEEYAKKKNNVAFVRNYLVKRGKLGLDNADVLDQYISIAKEKELLKPDFLNTLFTFDSQINADGRCFHFVVNHLSYISRLTGREEQDLVYSLQSSVKEYSLQKAIRLKDTAMLNALLKVDSFFRQRLGGDSLELHLHYLGDYYYGIRDISAYKESAYKLVAYYRSGKDTLTLEESRGNFALSMSDIASRVARLTDEREFLLDALSWAAEAAIVWDHFSTEEAFAEVLYALGSRDEAIMWMKQAREKAIHDMNDTEGFAKQMLEKINRMTANQPLE